MNGPVDGATDSPSVSPRSRPIRRFPLSSQRRSPRSQGYPLRTRQIHRYPLRNLCLAKSEGSSIRQIEQGLRARYQERLESMPEHEKGRYWTWVTWPPGIRAPLQNEIECRKRMFQTYLESLMPGNEAEAYFRKGGPKVDIEMMRGHCEIATAAFTTKFNGPVDETKHEYLIVPHLLEQYKGEKPRAVSAQLIRAHATCIFTALARACNFVTLDVVVSTYEWIDEYLSIKYELSMERAEDYTELLFDPTEDQSAADRRKEETELQEDALRFFAR